MWATYKFVRRLHDDMDWTDKARGKTLLAITDENLLLIVKNMNKDNLSKTECSTIFMLDLILYTDIRTSEAF